MSKDLKPIYAAKKNGQLAVFEAGDWREMGNQRNGFVAISKSQYDDAVAGKKIKITEDTKNAENDLTVTQRTNALIAQGDGFLKDGKLDKALAKYQTAQSLGAGVADKISAVKTAILEAGEHLDPETGKPWNGDPPPPADTGTPVTGKIENSKAGDTPPPPATPAKAAKDLTPAQKTEFKNLVAAGDEAVAAGDNVLAREHYETAGAILTNKTIAAKLAEVEKALEK